MDKYHLILSMDLIDDILRSIVYRIIQLTIEHIELYIDYRHSYYISQIYRKITAIIIVSNMSCNSCNNIHRRLYCCMYTLYINNIGHHYNDFRLCNICLPEILKTQYVLSN